MSGRRVRETPLNRIRPWTRGHFMHALIDDIERGNIDWDGLEDDDECTICHDACVNYPDPPVSYRQIAQHMQYHRWQFTQPYAIEALFPTNAEEYAHPVLLRCGHVYHWACIANWTALGGENHRRCPICRAELFQAHPREYFGLVAQGHQHIVYLPTDDLPRADPENVSAFDVYNLPYPAARRVIRRLDRYHQGLLVSDFEDDELGGVVLTPDQWRIYGFLDGVLGVWEN